MRSHGLSGLGSSDKKQRHVSAFRTTFERAIVFARKRELEEASRRIDTEVLAVEGVANYLHCSVQAVRNIPADCLPRYDGPGRRKLFLKEDVIRYVQNTQVANAGADELLRDIENEQLEFPSDSGDTASQKEKKR